MDQRRVGSRLLAAGLVLVGLLALSPERHSAVSRLYPVTAVRVIYGSLRPDIHLGTNSRPVTSTTVPANVQGAFQFAPRTGFNLGPNYVHNLTGLQRWRQFPVSVAFIHDANDSPAREQEALAGFEQWVVASSGRVSFGLACAPRTAQITVRFDPTRLKSETVTRYDVRRRILYHADICIGTRVDDGSDGDVTPADVQALAAHEFGHALGIDGHSRSPDDLMYPSLGSSNRTISARDLSTLRQAYGAA